MKIIHASFMSDHKAFGEEKLWYTEKGNKKCLHLQKLQRFHGGQFLKDREISLVEVVVAEISVWR
jgi:hypothetical protein